MDIFKLVEYNIWANRLMGKQIETLPQEMFEKQLGGSFGSIKATLVHLLESDWIWLNRWKGIPLASIPLWELDHAAALNSEWSVIQNDMLSIARVLADSKNNKIAFVTRKGAQHTLLFEDIVVHVSNHGAYHRGQLTHMMREIGQKPVSTDYFIFCTQ